MKITTDSLGFELKVDIELDERVNGGRHVVYADENGRVPADAGHMIALSTSLDHRELVRIAAHEAYHLFYSIRDQITVDEETQASVFGDLVRAVYDLYPHRCPTCSFFED